MKCYIYFIINQITQERYVGQTTNFTRRKSEHKLKLSENRHPNPKLQAAWNKYGEDNFKIEKIQFDNISKQELNEQEIYYIAKYDSYNNGYNLTLGGTGGDCRSKLNFEQFCFAYFGNKKYAGMTVRTGKYLGVDSSCISAIVREKSYDAFREKALMLSEEEKNKYVKDFEKNLEIENNKPFVKRGTPDDQTTLKMLCVVSTYGKGIEQTILKKFDLSKGYIYHTMTGTGRLEIKKQYRDLAKEERQEIGRKYFKEWELQSFSKNKINEKYRDLFIHYGIADLK